MDYEVSDSECLKCNVSLHTRQCSEITCDEGLIDESDEDYLEPRTKMVECDRCAGTGNETWCPTCGTDYSGIIINSEEDDN